jgi:hypothetical protein
LLGAADELRIPREAATAAARPKLNFLSACRRVVAWANPLASSSNLLFILFLSFLLFALLLTINQLQPVATA